MLKSSMESYDTMFFENIFDTVKKAKTAKIEAKLLSTSKAFESQSSQISNFKRKNPRKKAKQSAKVKNVKKSKKITPAQKTREGGVKRRKANKPTKKLAKKAPKVSTEYPSTEDIDIEAAFILSSISQRSFDSFYSRFNVCGERNIEIPLTDAIDKNYSQDLAYSVLLDHNYWVPDKSAVENGSEKDIKITQNTMSVNQNVNDEVCESNQKPSSFVENEHIKTEITTDSCNSMSTEVNNNKVLDDSCENNPCSSPLSKCAKLCVPSLECKDEQKRCLSPKSELTPMPENSAASAQISSTFILSTKPLKKRKTRKTIEENKVIPKKKANVKIENELPETRIINEISSEDKTNEEIQKTVDTTKIDLEEDEKTEKEIWARVMEFHSSQLERLEIANKRFADTKICIKEGFAIGNRAFTTASQNPIKMSPTNNHGSTYPSARALTIDCLTMKASGESLDSFETMRNSLCLPISPFQRSLSGVSMQNTSRKAVEYDSSFYPQSQFTDKYIFLQNKYREQDYSSKALYTPYSKYREQKMINQQQHVEVSSL